MDKIERYRQVYNEFKELCARGEQKVTFTAFCRVRGVRGDKMQDVLGDEFVTLKAIPGYRVILPKKPKPDDDICGRIYENFRTLCAEGRQPGSFSNYCKTRGVAVASVWWFMRDHNLRLIDIPGFRLRKDTHKTAQEVPFANVIFEEAGF
ncbi:MAG: hypothetical protein LUC85_00520 [Bacteroidales bacterium]|nr:hypothetical protein [Bacteroidales bacterium]